MGPGVALPAADPPRWWQQLCRGGHGLLTVKIDVHQPLAGRTQQYPDVAGAAWWEETVEVVRPGPQRLPFRPRLAGRMVPRLFIPVTDRDRQCLQRQVEAGRRS